MARRRDIDSIINGLAAETCGVVDARALRAEGISRDAVAVRVARGTMVPMLPRTWAVGPMARNPTFEMRCMAGALAGGPGAVLDGSAAARLRGVWDRGNDFVDISLPDGARSRATGWRFHRMRRSVGDAHVPGVNAPIPMASFPDMALMMARTHTPWQVAAVLREGCFRGMTDLAEIQSFVASHAWCSGVPVLRQALVLRRAGSAGTRSRSEDVLLGGLLRARALVPAVNQRGILGLSRDEPDFVWLAQRLNVEVDGEQHDEPTQAEDDRRRDAELAERGIHVIRIRSVDVWTRRRAVIRRIMDELARRRTY